MAVQVAKVTPFYVGASTDTKPTNPSFYFFHETDTDDWFAWSGSAWVSSSFAAVINIPSDDEKAALAGAASPSAANVFATMDDIAESEVDVTEVLAAYPIKAAYEFIYDFSVQGGADSDLALTAPNGAIPANFVIQNASLDVLTLIAGIAGTTAALTVESAGDLVAATIVAGAPWSTTGRKVTIPLLSVIATWVKTTAQRTPVFTPGVHAVTGGKFRLFIEGFQSA